MYNRDSDGYYSLGGSDDYIDKYRQAVYNVLEEKHMTLTPTANFGRRQTDTVVRVSFKLIYPNE